MCTALSLYVKDGYFGRTLDLDCSFGEEVCVMPRNFPIDYRALGRQKEHFAIIGMATVAEGQPLFYDGANEHGLAMAGLNFPSNAYYYQPKKGYDNIASFELIPWILSQCRYLFEARLLLERLNIVNASFSESLPPYPLHWIISDGKESLVVESMRDGLHIHQNRAGVLTNNPPFEYQIFNLNNYRGLRNDNGREGTWKGVELEGYCQGLGALGLPGDLSSMSRFVRIAFGRANSVCEENESSAVGQFFHLLSGVEMSRGLCVTGEGGLDITVYSSCINLDRGLYYYTTYDNRRISCVDMHGTDIFGGELCRFPLKTAQSIFYQGLEEEKKEEALEKERHERETQLYCH